MKKKHSESIRYTFLDSGGGEKLEQFGPYRLIRPSAQAVWRPILSRQEWEIADMRFTRDRGNQWIGKNPRAASWMISLEELEFELNPTEFGHLGIFPEHATQWAWMRKLIQGARRQVTLLNLFAYTGGATLAAAQAGAEVCHVDASKAAVSWARRNAELNHLTDRPIRWITEDVLKFVEREQKRQKIYDAIILDPPSFGRGRQGEVFKIERDLLPLLDGCKNLLSKNPLFFLVTAHTSGFSPLTMNNLLHQLLGTAVETGELSISATTSYPLPSGYFGRWCAPFH
jgi:23S rRNA (cytosine1962-C5)-methyltransferase